MFGFGKPSSAINMPTSGGRNTNVPFDDFGEVLSSMGINPQTSQEDLWKIYEESIKKGNSKIVNTLDKYYDWWK